MGGKQRFGRKTSALRFRIALVVPFAPDALSCP